MPATPAWPPRSAPRLFVDQSLEKDMQITLDGPAAHYLLKVMRLAEGAVLTLFDDRTGDYPATIISADKRRCTVSIGDRLRAREEVPDVWLCAAPIKRQRFDWVAEKACELGVRRFVPVGTARAVVDKVKEDRMRAHMIEAAEQCERNALPQLADFTSLGALLAEWPGKRHLFFCDERGGSSFRGALRAQDGPAAILIGPEGGFTDEENAMIRDLPQAVPVSLGPRILRADTAAVAAISLWMAGRGDWS